VVDSHLVTVRAVDDVVAERVRLGMLSIGTRRGVVAAASEDSAPTTLGWGSQPSDAAVEAGSVTKCVTGLLLALADAAGEVSPTDPLKRFLRVGGAGSATLAELATHSSGLPRLPSLFVLQVLMHRRNPYLGYDLDRLLWQTRLTTKGRSGYTSYSNLGVALLGHALAAAAGTDYWTLATERVLGPLGMLRSGSLPDDQTWSSGRLWNLGAFGPAGGLRGPVVDLFELARLAADPSGSALGAAAADALRPRLPMGGGHVGWCWMTLQTPTGVLRWHNGGTGAGWAMVAGGRGAAAAISVGTLPMPAYDAAMLTAMRESIRP
jgi:CubicO group peptidase (beta-lactamase class C family)